MPSRHLQHGLAAATAVLCACTTPRSMVDSQETFDSAATYSRTYAAVDAQACEAARRTLLSQGYVVSLATAEQVKGRKSFQPEPESHVQVEFTVVCARDGYAGKRTIAFVNAVQDRYALKKSASSASVGVGVLGSLSLPFSASDDSLVKVASATITSAAFYNRFFQLVERYLVGDPGQRIEPVADAMDDRPPPLATPSVTTPVSKPPVAPPPVPVPAVPAPASAPAPAASSAAPASGSASAPAPAVLALPAAAPAPAAPAASVPLTAP